MRGMGVLTGSTFQSVEPAFLYPECHKLSLDALVCDLAYRLYPAMCLRPITAVVASSVTEKSDLAKLLTARLNEVYRQTPNKQGKQEPIRFVLFDRLNSGRFTVGKNLVEHVKGKSVIVLDDVLDLTGQTEALCSAARTSGASIAALATIICPTPLTNGEADEYYVVSVVPEQVRER